MIDFVCVADVAITKVLEGNVRISCRNLQAQMINGNSVDIACNGSAAIAAIYSTSSKVEADYGLKIDLSHGHIQVSPPTGTLQLSIHNPRTALVHIRRFNHIIRIYCTTLSTSCDRLIRHRRARKEISPSAMWTVRSTCTPRAEMRWCKSTSCSPSPLAAWSVCWGV
jgi:hypothetical protein